MKNQYGVQLDSNGYAPSLMVDGECFICGSRGDLARHEAFGGPNRQKSKALGLWATVCPRCHDMCHADPSGTGLLIKRKAQALAMSHYDWSECDFIREMGRSYL